MIEIILIISSPYFIQNDDGDMLTRDSELLLPGNYYVISDGPIDINNEIILTRTISVTTGTRTRGFTNQVRQRDGRCVVTKEENPLAAAEFWTGFEAAHMFPLAYEQYWIDQNFSRWITIPESRGGPINSVQNGLLLRSDIHQLFNTYLFSINPDVSSA